MRAEIIAAWLADLDVTRPKFNPNVRRKRARADSFDHENSQHIDNTPPAHVAHKCRRVASKEIVETQARNTVSHRDTSPNKRRRRQSPLRENADRLDELETPRPHRRAAREAMRSEAAVPSPDIPPSAAHSAFTAALCNPPRRST